MQNIFGKYTFLLLLFLTGNYGYAFAQNALSAEEIELYSSDAEKLVSFLEFTFNTIGDPEVSTKDKDVIINQSYAKFFRDEKVQIEDDLDENRETPINKDVQAYLKDIDFFFKNVTFTFSINQIEHQINENNQLFFKITLNRNLQGITILGDTVNNNRVRYIEINLNDTEKDLKIASIYTTKLNEKEELRNWWQNLPEIWKEILGKNIILQDTIRLRDVVWFNDSIAKLNYLVKWKMSRDTLTFESEDSLYVSLYDTAHFNANLIDRQIRKITELDTINISGSSKIISVEPLSKLDGLKRIDCSHTMVQDLMPLRNLTHLEYLNCSHTAVSSIEPLKYSTNLQEINIDFSLVDDISPVINFTQLGKFYLNHTPVDSLQPLAELPKLKDLEFAGTNVKSLEAVQNLISLERIDFSETEISDISPLSGLKNIYMLKMENTQVQNLQPAKDFSSLHFLFADQTLIQDLSPLNGLPELNRIYCDKTNVSRNEATRFMTNNPNVLVVYESADLVSWWKNLSVAWKNVFSKEVSLMGNPSKEDLHRIIRIKDLNISGNKQIETLDPLLNLSQLTSLNCQGTGISGLEALGSLADLGELNFSDTKVEDVKPLEKLTKLEKLSFDRTRVSSIAPIMLLTDLRIVYCDNSPVDVEEIIEFMKVNPTCLVVYQTDKLELWWDRLPEVWKLLAEKFLKTNQSLSREQLQEIANLRRIDLSDFPEMDERSTEIKSIQYIDKLIFLESLKFTNTAITSLEPLKGMDSLKSLVCPNNPIETLEPLSEVRNLEILDVQNTPVSSLEYLAGLYNLKKLNCSGTQIKNLKGLEILDNLEQLDCYNTSIKNLNELEKSGALKLIRCYNTRISERRIEKFREAHPGIEIIFY